MGSPAKPKTPRAAAPSSSPPRCCRGCSASRTTLLLIRGLGPSDFGAFGRLSLFALLLAELGELGLQTLASRALVAGTLSLARAGAGAARARRAAWGVRRSPRLGVAPVLAPLVLWFALSGWGEFLGVALRCRGRRVAEALLLLCLRGVRARSRPRWCSAAGAGLEALAWSLVALDGCRRCCWAPSCCARRGRALAGGDAGRRRR